jgi:hypothetical protein
MVLRILVIVGLGGLLFLINTLQTVSSRRLFFDLASGRAEVASERIQQMHEHVQEAECETLEVNAFCIPALVFVAVPPYARRRKSELVTTPRVDIGHGGVRS